MRYDQIKQTDYGLFRSADPQGVKNEGGRDNAFDEWNRATLEDLCCQWVSVPRREPYWNSAFAVDDTEWLGAIGGEKHDLTAYIQPAREDETQTKEVPEILRLPQTAFLQLWKDLIGKKR